MRHTVIKVYSHLELALTHQIISPWWKTSFTIGVTSSPEVYLTVHKPCHVLLSIGNDSEVDSLIHSLQLTPIRRWSTPLTFILFQTAIIFVIIHWSCATVIPIVSCYYIDMHVVPKVWCCILLIVWAHISVIIFCTQGKLMCLHPRWCHILWVHSFCWFTACGLRTSCISDRGSLSHSWNYKINGLLYSDLSLKKCK